MLQGNQSNSEDIILEPTHAAEMHIHRVGRNTKSLKAESSCSHTSSWLR